MRGCVNDMIIAVQYIYCSWILGKVVNEQSETPIAPWEPERRGRAHCHYIAARHAGWRLVEELRVGSHRVLVLPPIRRGVALWGVWTCACLCAGVVQGACTCQRACERAHSRPG